MYMCIYLCGPTASPAVSSYLRHQDNGFAVPGYKGRLLTCTNSTREEQILYMCSITLTVCMSTKQETWPTVLV